MECLEMFALLFSLCMFIDPVQHKQLQDAEAVIRWTNVHVTAT